MVRVPIESLLLKQQGQSNLISRSQTIYKSVAGKVSEESEMDLEIVDRQNVVEQFLAESFEGSPVSLAD